MTTEEPKTINIDTRIAELMQKRFQLREQLIDVEARISEIQNLVSGTLNEANQNADSATNH